jgi:hypothetical protein
MSRPEHTAPPEIFYNEAEAAKVQRAVARIRRAMTSCCPHSPRHDLMLPAFAAP